MSLPSREEAKGQREGERKYSDGSSFHSEFASAGGTALFLTKQTIRRVTHELVTLGIRAHIFTLEILGSSLPVVYAMVIEALHKAVRHQSQADDGEDDGQTEDGISPSQSSCQCSNSTTSQGKQRRCTAQNIDAVLVSLNIKNPSVILIPHVLKMLDGIFGSSRPRRRTSLHMWRGSQLEGQKVSNPYRSIGTQLDKPQSIIRDMASSFF